MRGFIRSGVARRFTGTVRRLGSTSNVALRLWVLALGFVPTHSGAHAAPTSHDTGFELQDHRSYSEDANALEAARFRDRACNGDAVAAVTLARMYLSGNGWFEEDPARGKAFLRLAVYGGNYQAAADLAVVILKASQDDPALQEAAKWVKVALYDAPTPQALMAAGVVKMIGQGKDLAPAYQDGVRWYVTHKGKSDGYVDPNVCGYK